MSGEEVGHEERNETFDGKVMSRRAANKVLYLTNNGLYGKFYYGGEKSGWQKDIRSFGDVKVSEGSASEDVDGRRARDRLNALVALSMLSRSGVANVWELDGGGDAEGATRVSDLVEREVMSVAERLGENTMLASMRIETASGERQDVKFCDLWEFDPVISPRNVNTRPSLLLKALDVRYKRFDTVENENRGTYRKTKEVLGEEADKELFNVITNYLWQNPTGKELKKRLKIKDTYTLMTLTPRQAVELSNQIVAELTNYDYGGIGGGPNRADEMTAVDLLKNGLQTNFDGEIRPLGVCRNYADAAKLVFEVLKKSQDKQFSRLRSTFCVWSAGGASTFSYRANTVGDGGGAGHAWNTYVTQMEDGSCVIVVTDPTHKYVGKDGKLDTLQPKYTAERLEKLMKYIYVESGREKNEYNVRELAKFYRVAIHSEKDEVAADFLLGRAADVYGAAIELAGSLPYSFKDEEGGGLGLVLDRYASLLEKVIDGKYNYVIDEKRRLYEGILKFANAAGRREGVDRDRVGRVKELLGEVRGRVGF